MDIAFRVHRDIKVDDMGNAVDVNASCCDIGGHQNLNPVFSKCLESALPGILRFVAVDRRRVNAALI